MFLEAPAKETLLFLGEFLIVGLDAGTVLGYQPLHFFFDAPVFLALARLQFLHGFLENTLVGVEGSIAPHRVFNDLFQFYSGSFQGQQNRAALHFGGETAYVLALEHVGYFENGVTMGRLANFGCRVDVIEGVWVVHRGCESGLGRHT